MPQDFGDHLVGVVFQHGDQPYCEALINELIPQRRRSERFPYRVFSREDSEDSTIDGKLVFTKNVRRRFWEANDIGANITNTLISCILLT
jgi:hypothetical protein